MTTASDAATQEAYKIVQSCIESLTERIRAGEVTEDDLSDAIHEEADGALIYTSDQYACVWGLPDGEDAIESGLCEPRNFSEALSAQAYCNLRAAIEAHDFSDAFDTQEGA